MRLELCEEPTKEHREQFHQTRNPYRLQCPSSESHKHCIRSPCSANRVGFEYRGFTAITMCVARDHAEETREGNEYGETDEAQVVRTLIHHLQKFRILCSAYS